jgi:hypothetical protein
MPSSFQGIAPRISRSRSPTALVTTQQPSLEQVAAAVQLNIPFAELISRPDLTREEVWNWGRAKAILNDYTEAAKAYIHLLGMPQP